MEAALPIEEIAAQRLQVLVNAYTLLIKNLKAEGVALDKVQAASDKTWQMLGRAAGDQLKTLFADSPVKDTLFTAHTIASAVHGMQVKEERRYSEKRVKVEKCPWHEAALAFALPADWRLCLGGHKAFAETMLQTIAPEARFEITQSLVEGAPFCDERVGV
jgi:hypothetical protein